MSIYNWDFEVDGAVDSKRQPPAWRVKSLTYSENTGFTTDLHGRVAFVIWNMEYIN